MNNAQFSKDIIENFFSKNSKWKIQYRENFELIELLYRNHHFEF